MLSSTDYSNTIFYKIYCKDVNIPDVYVGHTTDFVQRKRAHKNSCHNPSYPVYNCKLYTTIRRLGGWDNWNMDIIAFHKCNDQYDARKREQEYFVSLGATLNSIEPLPTPAEKPLPAANLVERDHAKYYCEKCHFDTTKKTDYERHINTRKHINNHIINVKKNKIRQKNYGCETCDKTFMDRSGLRRHRQKCGTNTHTELPPQLHDASLVMELIKQNQEFKELMMLQSKQLAEQQLHNTLLLEAVIPLRHAI